MKKVLLSLLILVSLLECLAQEDLQKKVFVFPAASNTAAVVLKAPLQQPLTTFTVCLRHYTLLTRAFGLFSYATKEKANELLLFKPAPNQYEIDVGNTFVTFTIPGKETSEPSWEHICMSWESATGVVELWVDGQPLPRMGVQKGYSVSPGASIVLGQDQDSFGGGFDINQSFVGEITDVYMWDRVPAPDEMGLVRDGRVLSNYLINWRLLTYKIEAYVVVKPSLIP